MMYGKNEGNYDSDCLKLLSNPIQSNKSSVSYSMVQKVMSNCILCPSEAVRSQGNLWHQHDVVDHCS